MSISWSFFVSRRIRKCDVDSWLEKLGIENIEQLTRYLRPLKVRPPSLQELSNIKWPPSKIAPPNQSSAPTISVYAAHICALPRRAAIATTDAPLAVADVTPLAESAATEDNDISLGQEALNTAIENSKNKSVRQKKATTKKATTKKVTTKKATTRKRKVKKDKE